MDDGIRRGRAAAAEFLFGRWEERRQQTVNKMGIFD